MEPIKILGTLAGIGFWNLAALFLDSPMMFAAVPLGIITFVAFEYFYRHSDPE